MKGSKMDTKIKALAGVVSKREGLHFVHAANRAAKAVRIAEEAIRLVGVEADGATANRKVVEVAKAEGASKATTALALEVAATILALG